MIFFSLSNFSDIIAKNQKTKLLEWAGQLFSFSENSITITTLPVSQFSCSRPRETCDGTYPLTFVFLVLIRPLLWTSYWYTMGWKPFWRSMLIFYAFSLISELICLLFLVLYLICKKSGFKFLCGGDVFSQNFSKSSPMQ